MSGDITTKADSLRIHNIERGFPSLYGATAVRRQGWTSPENPDTFVGCRIPARGQHSPITVSDENELGTNDSDSYEDNDGSSADNEYDTDLDLQEDGEDPEPHIGICRYEEVCERTATAPQRAIIRGLPGPELNIAHRALGCIAIKPLAAALVRNTVVQRVDLTDNSIGPEGAVYVAEMLKKNEFITDFNLADNAIGARGADAIGIMLGENRGLVRLNLSGNDFSDEKAAMCIGDGILCNDRLEYLDLSHNELNERGAAYIALALRENVSIETLNIGWNKLRQKGTVSLCAGIQMNKVVTHLDLRWNGLGYGGSLALKTLLTSNKHLLEIDASHNDIHWEGALLISEGLQLNQTLKVLRLGHNVLTTTGCMDLIEAASKSGLSMLDLAGVPVIAEFELMAAAISQTRVFERIHGGLVNSHDILGQRHGRRAPAMQRVLDYMKVASIRTSELVRSFDKRAANNIDMDEFVYRIRKSGIEMQRYELEELLAHIARTKHDDSVRNINYQLMAQSVNAHIKQERMVKIKALQKLERKETYHAAILQGDLPPIVEQAVDEKGRAKWSLLKQSLRHFPRPEVLQREGSHVSGFSDHHHTTGGTLAPLPREKTEIMSMATALGGKAVKFGTAAVKKKKKKKRKTKKK